MLGSVEDELDLDALETCIVDALPAEAHFKHRLQFTFLGLRDQVSTFLKGKDNVLAQRLMVNLCTSFICDEICHSSQGSPTMDSEQSTHVEHFFYAQVRLTYADVVAVLVPTTLSSIPLMATFLI